MGRAEDGLVEMVLLQQEGENSAVLRLRDLLLTVGLHCLPANQEPQLRPRYSAFCPAVKPEIFENTKIISENIRKYSIILENF